MFHLRSLDSIFSTMGDQTDGSCTLFPSHAPSMRIAWPSRAIRTSGGNATDVMFSFEDVISDCRYSGVPTGIISVLSMLNLAPEAQHHVDRMVLSIPGSSLAARYTVVSSANMETIER